MKHNSSPFSCTPQFNILIFKTKIIMIIIIALVTTTGHNLCAVCKMEQLESFQLIRNIYNYNSSRFSCTPKNKLHDHPHCVGHNLCAVCKMGPFSSPTAQQYVTTWPITPLFVFPFLFVFWPYFDLHLYFFVFSFISVKFKIFWIYFIYFVTQ